MQQLAYTLYKDIYNYIIDDIEKYKNTFCTEPHLRIIDGHILHWKTRLNMKNYINCKFFNLKIKFATII